MKRTTAIMQTARLTALLAALIIGAWGCGGSRGARPDVSPDTRRDVQTWDCGADSGSVTATLKDDGTLVVRGTGAMKDYYRHREIAPWRDMKDSITGVIIEDGVTAIGKKMFADCANLASVTIPQSVTSIGEMAFMNCTGLKSITIPGNVKSVGNEAFERCTSLTSVTIEDGAAQISYAMFYECKNLKSVVIPGSVESIGAFAFKGCTGLESVTIEKGVKSIGKEAFSGCTGLASVAIAGSVASIGEEAFKGCTGLTSIVIPNSMRSIGAGAFRGCTGLTSVTIPRRVNSIERQVFWGCTGLMSIEVAADNADYSSEDGVLFNKNKTALIRYPKGKPGDSYTIPRSVVSIEGYAFSGCTGLASVKIPRSVTAIGENAFAGCTGLTSVTIPRGVRSVGESAFAGCTGLTSVTIEDGVKSVGNRMFTGCKNLKSVVIPGSVELIRGRAFHNCAGLTSVTIGDGVKSIGGEAFYNCAGLASVTIPNSVESIESSAFEGSGLKSVIIPGSVAEIKSEAFKNCANLASVTIEDGVASIGEEAFEGSGLTSLAIPRSAVSIGKQAFYGCVNLASITVAADNPNYSSEDGVLFNKTKTALIRYPPGRQGFYKIPAGVTSIEDRAFSHSAGLTSVIIPGDVTFVGKKAFWGCSGLTSVVSQNHAPVYIENETFKGLPSDACLYVPKGSIRDYRKAQIWKKINCVKDLASAPEELDEHIDRVPPPPPAKQSWRSGETTVALLHDGTLRVGGRGAMGYDSHPWRDAASSITGLVIDDGVTGISHKAFAGLTGLKSVKIPGRVEEIGASAFYGCTGLTSVTIEEGVRNIRDGAFAGCTGLTSITIPRSVQNIGEQAFSGCTGLTSITVAADNPNYSSEDGVLFNKNRYGKKQINLALYPPGKSGAYTIPSGVAAVGERAFWGNAGLTSLTIPDGVKSVGKLAFYGCAGLASIICQSPAPPNAESESFHGAGAKTGTCLYVPKGSIDAYRSAGGWEDFRCISDIAELDNDRKAAIEETRKKSGKGAAEDAKKYSVAIKNGYRRFEPQYLSAGMTTINWIFPVPEANAVGTLDGHSNGIVFMKFGDYGESPECRVVAKDYGKRIYDLFYYRFSSNFTGEMIAYSQNRVAVMADVKTGKAFYVRYGLSREDYMLGIRFLDPQKNLFAVVKSVYNRTSERNDYLHVAKLEGENLVDAGWSMKLGETGYILPYFPFYNTWLVHDRKLFVYNDGQMLCIDGGEPASHPFSETFNANSDRFGRIEDIAIHPKLPFGIMIEEGRDSAGIRHKLKIARWDISDPQEKDKRIITFGKELEPLKSLFGLKKSMELAYQSFSPDGNWYVAGCIEPDERERKRSPHFIAVPVNRGHPDLLDWSNIVILGQIKEMISLAWVSNPTAYVATDGKLLHKWDLNELPNACVIAAPGDK